MINKIHERVRHLWNNRNYNNYNTYEKYCNSNYNEYAKIADELNIKSEFIYDCIIYCLSKDLDHKLFVSLIKPEYNNELIAKIVEILEHSKPEEINNKINLLIIES